MTTISVPIPADLEKFIDDMIADRRADNKASVVRNALYRAKEEEAVNNVLISQRELKEGKILSGDLRELVKKIK